MKRKLLLTIFLLLAFSFTSCNKAEKDGGDESTMNKTTPKATITAVPTPIPTEMPTSIPTAVPTSVPTAGPTVAPTAAAAEATGTENATASLYKDGVYDVETSIDYEGYFVKATVTIEGSMITAVDWSIYDNTNKLPFDEDYYQFFEDQGLSAVYVQQAKDDWAGSRGYADALIESQDINEVDAVSGATWANKEFKLAINMALEEAAAE